MRNELELLDDKKIDNMSTEEQQFCQDVNNLLAQASTFEPPEEIDRRILMAVKAFKRQRLLSRILAVAAIFIIGLTLFSLLGQPKKISNIEESVDYKNFIQKIDAKPKVLVENKKLNESWDRLDNKILEFEEELFLLALEIKIGE